MQEMTPLGATERSIAAAELRRIPFGTNLRVNKKTLALLKVRLCSYVCSGRAFKQAQIEWRIWSQEIVTNFAVQANDIESER